MAGLTLLARARRAGLSIEARGSDLLIRGPRSLADWIPALRERKAEVLAELVGQAACGGPPTTPTIGTSDVPEPGDRIDGWPVAPDPPLKGEWLTRDQLFGTIAVQHCHPRVLADRIGLPLDEVLRRLESSLWSWHGARLRARLGVDSRQQAGPSNPQAPLELDLHFPAR